MRSPNNSYIRRDTTSLHCSPTGWTPCVTELPDGSLFAASSQEWVSIALNSPLNGSFYITIEKENTPASTNMQECPLFPLCPFWFCTCSWDWLEQTYFLQSFLFLYEMWLYLLYLTKLFKIKGEGPCEPSLYYYIIPSLYYISYIPTENITNFILHGLKLSFFIPTLCYVYFLLFLYASVLL